MQATTPAHARMSLFPALLAGLVVVSPAPKSVAAQEPAAVFEIEGEVYAFDRVLCSLPESAEGDVSVSARQDGLQLDITRNQAVGAVVSLSDYETPMNPSVSWEAPDPAMMPSQRRALDLIQVNGTDVLVEATFHNEHTAAAAEGRVEVHCPSGG